MRHDISAASSHKVLTTLTAGAVRLRDPERPQSSPRQTSGRGWRLRGPGHALLHPPEGGAAQRVRLSAGPGVFHLLRAGVLHFIRTAVWECLRRKVWDKGKASTYKIYNGSQTPISGGWWFLKQFIRWLSPSVRRSMLDYLRGAVHHRIRSGKYSRQNIESDPPSMSKIFLFFFCFLALPWLLFEQECSTKYEQKCKTEYDDVCETKESDQSRTYNAMSPVLSLVSIPVT